MMPLIFKRQKPAWNPLRLQRLKKRQPLRDGNPVVFLTVNHQRWRSSLGKITQKLRAGGVVFVECYNV